MDMLDLYDEEESWSSTSEESPEPTLADDTETLYSTEETDTVPSQGALSDDISESASALSVRGELQRGPRRHAARRKLVGSRRARADKIRNVFAWPNLLRTCENFQVECLGLEGGPLSNLVFNRRDIWDAYDEESLDSVVVAVEATAICESDLDVRRRMANSGVDEPFVLGSNFVGVVHHCGPEAKELGIKPGTRVASLVNWGANSKYVTIPAMKLSIVPKQLDAADVAALLSSYLPAFQALHHGRPRLEKYGRGCLKGKNVLVIGGRSLQAQAVLRLARFAGASEIYVTSPRQHSHVLNKLSTVTVLDEHPEDWLPVVKRDMDIVVDFRFPEHCSQAYKALAPKGRLICIAPKYNKTDGAWFALLEEFLQSYWLSSIKGASMFDFTENFDMNPDELVADTNYLLRLLATRQIRPIIDRYIKLSDIPSVHNEIRSRCRTGAVVCEPWKE